MIAQKIKQRLFIPVILALFIVTILSVSGVYWLQRQQVEKDVNDRADSLQELFQIKLDEEAVKIHGIIDFLKNDEALQKQWLQKDRERLLALSTPIFESIRDQYFITHFYFHQKDKINFLRVHQPERHGDEILRFTMNDAVQNGQPSYGIELGPLGTFTLRVVHPWIIDGQLSGYIELGEEITHITPVLKKILDVDLIFSIEKKHLNRAGWEEGLQAMRRTGSWDSFSNIAVIDSTFDFSRINFAETMNSSLNTSTNNNITLKVPDHIYKCKILPLRDVAGRNLGKILLLREITEQVSALKKLLATLLTFASLCGLLLYVSFYIFLVRREKTLQDRHEGNILKKQVELEQTNEQLKLEIEERLRMEDEKSGLESRLRQSQKMEAIGTLAGGIAHDFNNILTSMLGYTEMAKDDLPEGSPTVEDLENVTLAGRRAQKLIKQILTFSRQSETLRIPLQPQPIIKEVLKLLRSSIPETIEIHHHIEPRCGVIDADPTEIHQILMNLCTNAYHAMEESGGVLEVRLGCTDLFPDDLTDDLDVEPGSYIKLTVSDTGKGIEKKIVDKIFDPYFTTKDVGKGTGLGLSVIYGIVKSYDGLIRVESEVGKGATFHVFIPVAKEEQYPEPEKIEAVPEGDEHILFVDDEKMVVEVGKEKLGKRGYSVTTRCSSIEALELFRANPERFDLVITDYVMPGMNGADLSRELMKIRSDIPIILCTGFSNKFSAETAQSIGIKGFVMKPIVIHQLEMTIRNILDH
ncbi:ATP-binding protein [Thermodesulfobacteriota bacterium]